MLRRLATSWAPRNDGEAVPPVRRRVRPGRARRARTLARQIKQEPSQLTLTATVAWLPFLSVRVTLQALTMFEIVKVACFAPPLPGVTVASWEAVTLQ